MGTIDAQVKYMGPTRRGAGLVRRELYTVLDNQWRSMIKIRTANGSEVYVARHLFAGEPPPLKTGLQISKSPGRGWSRVSFGGVTEVRMGPLHLVVKH